MMMIVKSKEPRPANSMKHRRPHHKPRRKLDDDSSLFSKTRVCIKNLPAQNFSDHDLRNFLLTQHGQWRITDCRILAKKNKHGSRRMAFVGFATEEEAQQCVQRLHRAYCRTCRLMVEFAQLPTTREEAQEQEATESTQKEKDDSKLDRRKQEFLAVMGVAPSEKKGTNKFWANDDNDTRNSVEASVDSASRKEAGKAASPFEKDQTDDSVSSSSDDDDDDDDSVDDADPLSRLNTEGAPTPNDDMAFLRSKQVQSDHLDEDVKDDTDSESSSSSSSESENSHVVESENNRGSDDTEQNVPPSSSETVHSNRLFLRNLPFSATEDDIQQHFETSGTVRECHVPIDDHGQSKGFAFVTFASTAEAQRALEELDGTDFQGRLLHVMMARPSRESIHETATSSLSYKERMEQERKANASTVSKGWSASFVRGDAVVDNLASRLGLRKGDILAVKDGLSAGDAAVRLALGETAVIEENRKYFAEHGIDMEALVSFGSEKDEGKTAKRSKTQILVKNLPYDTTTEELLKVFGGNGGCNPQSILLPPSRTIAVVEYEQGNEAKTAFRRLAYRRFKSVPLYLEWAPLAPISTATSTAPSTSVATENKQDVTDKSDELLTSSTSFTLYVKNLNFRTTEDDLKRHLLSHVDGSIRNIRIPKKVSAKRSRDNQTTEHSMGYAFVELADAAVARQALQLVHGTILDGHVLDVQPTKDTTPSATTTVLNNKKRTSQQPSCLLVRNVPFQATRKELLQLFGAFGTLKKVRLPKRATGAHRGFAFVEFLTAAEAATAYQALGRTHLYGRHLVLEWAEDDGNKKIRFE